MAASKIKESYSFSITGIFDLANLYVEVDGLPKDLRDYLKKVDGELITLKISKTDEIE